MSTHGQTGAYAADRLVPCLTIAEVAAILGISRGSVYALIRSGELRPFRVGQRARFEPADVRAYLERNREGRAAP